MGIRLEDYVANLPKERQEAIAKRTAELIAEEATLRQVREARERSQEAVAKKLNIQDVTYVETNAFGGGFGGVNPRPMPAEMARAQYAPCVPPPRGGKRGRPAPAITLDGF